jgi:hypothetical protein
MRAMTQAGGAAETDEPRMKYAEVAVSGDAVERLMTEIFRDHWAAIYAGPVIEGAAWEIRFTAQPKVSMLDGYLTVDTGPWHFHLCVNDHRGAPTPQQARLRRVARAAFFHTNGGECVPATWGLRLWNGHGEQMITVFFPNPWLDDDGNRVREPRWERMALWERLRRTYAARERE